MKARQVSQTMIARELGVAQRTVSKALRDEPGVSDELRGKVKALAERMSYRGNRLMRTLIEGKSRTVGVCLPGLSVDQYLGGIFTGIEDVLQPRKYKMMFSSWNHDSEDDEAEIITLLQYNVDGLIVFPRFPTVGHEAFFRKLIAVGDKIVFLNEPFLADGCGSVFSDDPKGMRELVAHLHSLGHRSIAFAGTLSEFDTRTNSVLNRRFAACADECAKRGMRLRHIPVAKGDVVSASMAAFEAFLNDRQGVTALACFNDYIAIGAIRQARRMGVDVPAELSVCGYGDVFSHADDFSVPLTTVSQSSLEIGRTAATMCLDMIEELAAPRNVAIPTSLIIRKSTAAARPAT